MYVYWGRWCVLVDLGMCLNTFLRYFICFCLLPFPHLLFYQYNCISMVPSTNKEITNQWRSKFMMSNYRNISTLHHKTLLCFNAWIIKMMLESPRSNIIFWLIGTHTTTKVSGCFIFTRQSTHILAYVKAIHCWESMACLMSHVAWKF